MFVTGINEGKADFTYYSWVSHWFNLLRHWQRCLKGHEQRRLSIFHCHVHHVHRHDAHDSYL